MKRLVLVVGLSLCSSGCWFGGKKPGVRVPPVPKPKAGATGLPAAVPQALPEPEPAVPVKTVEPPKPVTPAVRPRPAVRPGSKPAAPLPPVGAGVGPQPAAPRLGELLSPAQARQVEAEYQASLQRAQGVVARADGRTLTRAQRETLERIKVFIGQARNERERDPATALQLARRADLLGQDLLKGLPQ